MQIIGRTSKRVGAGTGAVLLVAALLASAALAIVPAQTREGYIAQVEPICKKNTKSNERILQGVRKKIKDGELKAAGGQFSRAATAFGKAVTELRGVQQPAEDSAKLTKWLTKLDGQTKLLRKMTKALNEGKRSQVVGLQTQLVQNAEAANSAVLDFDFDYCVIDSSKFT